LVVAAQRLALLHDALELVLKRLFGLTNALGARGWCELHVEATPRGCMAKWDGAHVAVGEQAQRLRLALFIREHEETIELSSSAAMLDAAHVGKAHCKRLQMVRLQVLNAADEEGTLSTARLKLRVVRPKLIAHVVALVQGHLRQPSAAELANDGLWWRVLLHTVVPTHGAGAHGPAMSAAAKGLSYLIATAAIATSASGAARATAHTALVWHVALMPLCSIVVAKALERRKRRLDSRGIAWSLL
jgi:hypothetical protein